MQDELNRSRQRADRKARRVENICARSESRCRISDEKFRTARKRTTSRSSRSSLRRWHAFGSRTLEREYFEVATRLRILLRVRQTFCTKRLPVRKTCICSKVSKIHLDTDPAGCNVAKRDPSARTSSNNRCRRIAQRLFHKHVHIPAEHSATASLLTSDTLRCSVCTRSPSLSS